MDPRLDPRDQRVLPVQPLDLPDAERGEERDRRKQKRGEPDGPPRRVPVP
ncbi:hypothetical protein [Novosphingobium soli]|uniref:Uncharacterized protein n=1 Tax=Novosphingobium soli TaxID=574956 RepID=A0ABV6CWZ1_9SPHN